MNFQRTSPANGPRILCIGMPVRDMVFRVNDLPARGMKTRATHFNELSGGNALNAGVAIARLGGRVLMSGPMGDAGEKASAYIFDDLAKEGIDGSGIVRMPGLVTPISNIMIDPSGERTIVTYRDPALWKVKLPDTDTLLDGCDALLTENLSGIMQLFDQILKNSLMSGCCNIEVTDERDTTEPEHAGSFT